MIKVSSRIITVDRTPVFMGQDALLAVDKFLQSMHLGKEGIYILADKNTRQHCLPLLQKHSGLLAGARVLDIDGGEDSKSLLTAERLWNDLLVSGAGRESLLVNLGGGVVSDLGGFVAAGYKRGISYINIPTTLLAQCDAAIGGKTSVNMGKLKNQVGFFHAARAVFIHPGFLNTLPEDQLRSGFAEIIKSALTGDAGLWHRLLKHPVNELLVLPVDHPLRQDLLTGAIRFKIGVAMKDYREKNLRKVLNFGHTIGHALETWSLMNSGRPLLHGEAVAAGMICAAWLSQQKSGLSIACAEEIKSYISAGFTRYPIDQSCKSALIDLMKYDKKSCNGLHRFTLLAGPGFPVINVVCLEPEISGAIDFYNR
jgi:3-dehydroquinate synthase